ncbi:uncharacterized protein UBRO_12209 [Ustilago bromivora]|uniref:Uncharacterized protein n=1 Tax=Ustilago bromivora TaxID=307758 RepID=A0A1K0FWG5_9BASI|nr:uncharacterized protein UBRO_12209 [Ustilago bromivora]
MRADFLSLNMAKLLALLLVIMPFLLAIEAHGSHPDTPSIHFRMTKQRRIESRSFMSWLTRISSKASDWIFGDVSAPKKDESLIPKPAVGGVPVLPKMPYPYASGMVPRLASETLNGNGLVGGWMCMHVTPPTDDSAGAGASAGAGGADGSAGASGTSVGGFNNLGAGGSGASVGSGTGFKGAGGSYDGAAGGFTGGAGANPAFGGQQGVIPATGGYYGGAAGGAGAGGQQATGYYNGGGAGGAGVGGQQATGGYYNGGGAGGAGVGGQQATGYYNGGGAGGAGVGGQQATGYYNGGGAGGAGVGGQQATGGYYNGGAGVGGGDGGGMMGGGGALNGAGGAPVYNGAGVSQQGFGGGTVPAGKIRYNGQLMTIEQYQQAIASSGSSSPSLSRRELLQAKTANIMVDSLLHKRQSFDTAPAAPKKQAKVLMCINGDSAVPPIKFNTITGLRIRDASEKKDGVVAITNLPNYQMPWMPFLPTEEMWAEQQTLMLAQEKMIEQNMTTAPPPKQ